MRDTFYGRWPTKENENDKLIGRVNVHVVWKLDSRSINASIPWVG